MIRGAHGWVGASLFAVALALANCTDSPGAASSSADAGASWADGTADKGEGGASANVAPIAYADAGAAGAVPVCKTTDPAQCFVGEALVTSPDRYCPYCRTCALDEKNACLPYACGPAAHNEMAPGQCCSACVPNDTAACVTQQLAYLEQRQPLLEQYAAVCKKDADCASALVNTPCEQTCVAAKADSVAGLVADLSAVICPACALPRPVSARPDGQCAPATCLKGACVVAASGAAGAEGAK